MHPRLGRRPAGDVAASSRRSASTIMALSISALLLVLAATGHIQRSKELALIIAVVLLAILARAIYVGFWRGLERVGVNDARDRWEHQSPFLQRAVLPLVIAAIVIVVVWAAGLAPDPPLIVLLAITYALYLMPRNRRRIAVPDRGIDAGGRCTRTSSSRRTTRRSVQAPRLHGVPEHGHDGRIIVFAMMAIGLNMVVGYAGLLDLGYVAFYAIGAYTAAWLASPHFARLRRPTSTSARWRRRASPASAGSTCRSGSWLIIAGVLTAFAGILIGLPTLRLRGDYLAIVTLGFGEIVPQVARNGDKDGHRLQPHERPARDQPIDPPGFGGWLSRHVGLPDNYLTSTYSFDRGPVRELRHLMYWTAIGLLLITIFCSIRLRDSRLGRAWIAIREDEVAAAAMGIPLMRTKTWAYASGAFFGGVAGAWFGTFKTGVFPDDFFFNISVFILCMVILGGMGNVWGVIAGAAFLDVPQPRGDRKLQRLGQRHTCSCATRASRIRRQSSAAAASTRRSSRSGSTA